MAETRDERKARLAAELAAMDQQDREDDIQRASQEVTMGDVVHHLVSHSLGYPTVDDREAHLRAVRREFHMDPEPDEDQAEAVTGDAG